MSKVMNKVMGFLGMSDEDVNEIQEIDNEE